MIYSSHPKFDKEIGDFLEKHHQDDGWVFKLQNLLISHFEKKTTNLGINVLAPVGEYKDNKLWKVYMAIGGVRKNQSPRICFAKKDDQIVFLCFGTHIQNYKTNKLVKLGKQRIKEFIGE